MTEKEQRAAKAGNQSINGVELHALESALPDDVKTTEKPFNIYDDIRNKLVEKGIPRKEIVFIHEGATRSYI